LRLVGPVALAVLTLSASYVAAAEVAVEGVEVLVSRSGYNLLWPTKRCCAFDLRISSNGAATLTVKRGAGERPVTESRNYQVSADQMHSIRRTIEENDFTSLPSEICCFAIDGDDYRIVVRIGSRTHQVVFGEGASEKQLAELTRALNVWRAVRATSTIEGENVELEVNAF